MAVLRANADLMDEYVVDSNVWANYIVRGQNIEDLSTLFNFIPRFLIIPYYFGNY
jgi:hypothetical protein